MVATGQKSLMGKAREGTERGHLPGRNGGNGISFGTGINPARKRGQSELQKCLLPTPKGELFVWGGWKGEAAVVQTLHSSLYRPEFAWSVLVSTNRRAGVLKHVRLEQSPHLV